ncbi:hypothetical protein FLGSB24_08940 [Flavobacterium sp. GSB-24]|nr:hypothetical protein FLGSB24_08940 [Flavobacterium sp. GSB-24]
MHFSFTYFYQEFVTDKQIIMINSTRRSFIKNVGIAGAATLFSSSLIAQNTFTDFWDLKHSNEENILSKFLKLSASSTFQLDHSLQECYTKGIITWQKNGYEAVSDVCYSSQDGFLKMFPMHLHTETTGKIDDVLLCFGKNENGEWKAVKSLSGFDLEAISHAMTELKKNNPNVDLSKYLFPAPTQQLNPYSFDTQKGSVSLQTILASDQTSTKIIIKEGSSIVYQKEVISQHKLTVNSFLI